MQIGIIYYSISVILSFLKYILRIKRFGKNIGKGVLIKSKFPIGPTILTIGNFIYNIAFIIIKHKEISANYLTLFSMYTIICLFYGIFETIKNKNIVYIYEKGIMFDGYEIPYSKMREHNNSNNHYVCIDEDGRKFEYIKE